MGDGRLRMHAAESVCIRRISCDLASVYVRRCVADGAGVLFLICKKKTRVKKKLTGRQQGFSIFVGVGV